MDYIEIEDKSLTLGLVAKRVASPPWLYTLVLWVKGLFPHLDGTTWYWGERVVFPLCYDHSCWPIILCWTLLVLMLVPPSPSVIPWPFCHDDFPFTFVNLFWGGMESNYLHSIVFKKTYLPTLRTKPSLPIPLISWILFGYITYIGILWSKWPSRIHTN